MTHQPMPKTDVVAEIMQGLSDPNSNPDLRHLLRELVVQLLMEETADEPETVPVTITFHVHREDWNRYRAANRTHLEMTPHEAIVSMIQDCLYDGGPLEQGDFHVV